MSDIVEPMTERSPHVPPARASDLVSGREVLLTAPTRLPPLERFRVEDIKPRPPDSKCPFCVGNEHMTNSELFRVGKGELTKPGWQIRVFPSVNPPFDGPGDVVAITNDDWRSLGFLTVSEAQNALLAAQRSVIGQVQGPEKFLRTFVLCNNRAAAGASVKHPHWQVNSTDAPSKALQRETDWARTRGENALDQHLAFAVDHGLAVTDGTASSDAIAWVDPNVRSLCFRVAPVAPARSFAEAPKSQVREVAKTMQNLLSRIYGYFGNVPYNFVLENGIAVGKAAEVHRGWSVELWCREIVPDSEGGRTNVVYGAAVAGGFEEQLTNPFELAAALREVKPVPSKVWKDLAGRQFAAAQANSIDR